MEKLSGVVTPPLSSVADTKPSPITAVCADYFSDPVEGRTRVLTSQIGN